MIYTRITNVEDHRVYQQDSNGYADVLVQGTVQDIADAPGQVCVWLVREADGTHVLQPQMVQPQEGVFEATLLVPAGGPYTLRTCYVSDATPLSPSNGECRFHIGVGDVYVIAGQSNAVGFGRSPSADETDDRVQLFGMDRQWRNAAHPLSVGTDYPFTKLGDWAATGASPFLRFGNVLTRELNYPIGLLQTAQGGMPIKLWDKGVLLYDKMIEVIRLAGGKVKGIVWYQGCSDADTEQDAQRYEQKLTELIRNVREDLDQPELPFLVVQINRFMLDERHERWATVKEAQRRVARNVSNVYIAPSHDANMQDYAHNTAHAQQLIGQRLAWLALEQIYHRPFFGKSPDFDHAVYAGDQVKVYLRDVYFAIETCSLPVDRCDFTFEDAQGVNPVMAYQFHGKHGVFRLEREVQGDLYCSFAAGCQHSGVLPFDVATGNPVLGFYRQKAQKEVQV